MANLEKRSIVLMRRIKTYHRYTQARDYGGHYSFGPERSGASFPPLHPADRFVPPEALMKAAATGRPSTIRATGGLYQMALAFNPTLRCLVGIY